jgi:hypothetical protein
MIILVRFYLDRIMRHEQEDHAHSFSQDQDIDIEDEIDEHVVLMKDSESKIR